MHEYDYHIENHNPAGQKLAESGIINDPGGDYGG